MDEDDIPGVEVALVHMTRCQDEFSNSSGKTRNLKSPETPQKRYRQVRILDLDDIEVVSMQILAQNITNLKIKRVKVLCTKNGGFKTSREINFHTKHWLL